jgi:hypothetical protein
MFNVYVLYYIRSLASLKYPGEGNMNMLQPRERKDNNANNNNFVSK